MVQIVQSILIKKLPALRLQENLIYLVFFLFWISNLQSQQLLFQYYTTREGLPSNVVSSLFQDSKGFLWVGTEEGVSRFDGNTFTNYGISNDSIRMGFVFSIVESADGRIWVGGNGNGLFEIDGNHILHHSINSTPQANVVVNVIETKPNVMLLSTNDGIYEFREGKMQKIPPFDGQQEPFVVAYKDEQGSVWLLEQTALHRYDPASNKVLPGGIVAKNGERFDGAQMLLEGVIAIGTNLGKKMNFYKKDGLWLDVQPSGYSINSVLNDKEGRLWFATNRGIYITNRDHPSLKNAVWYSHVNGLADDNISTSLCDRDGHIWLGSGGKGLAKLEDPRTLRFLTPNTGFASLDDSERHWTTIPEGISVIERQSNGSFFEQRLDPFPGEYYQAMGKLFLLPGTKELWIVRSDGIVVNFFIREKNGKIQLERRRQISAKEGYTNFANIFLFIDRKQRLWLYSLIDRNVYVFDIQTEKPHLLLKLDLEAHTNLHDLRAITEDKAGNIWLGGQGSDLLELSDELIIREVFHAPGGISNLGVRSAYCSIQGILWFGTRADGLLRYKNGKFERYTTADGLIGNSVIALADGPSDHSIWIGSRTGVGFLEETTSGMRFGKVPNLTQSPVFSLGFLHDSTLWLSNCYEIIFHKKNPIKSDSVFVPPIYLKRFLVNGNEKSMDIQPLKLSATENNLVIEFGSVNLKSNLEIRYMYRLEGAETNWSVASTLQSVNFAGLKPGIYEFFVKAINSEGLESEKQSCFSFSILPPFWQRRWFIVSCIIVVTSLIWIFVRIHIRRLIEIERLRSKIAADLHDDIGSGLTRIALTSEMLLRQKVEPYDSNQSILFQKIGDTARELVESMSDIVWAIDPKNDSLEKLANRIQLFANDVCEAQSITCQFHFDNTFADFKPGSGVVSSIVLIAKEAINNAMRHSLCKTLFIKIHTDGQKLKLIVKDDGVGFNEKNLTRIYGLLNMRRRAEKMNGKLYIHSAPDQGSLIEVLLPMTG